MHAIATLDDLWMGRPRSIATALLESDGHRAIVDPGPGSTLETLRQQLHVHGFSVSDLDAILLTPSTWTTPAPPARWSAKIPGLPCTSTNSARRTCSIPQNCWRAP